MNEKLLYKEYEANPARNYERFFVPLIGQPLAHDLIELAKLQPGEDVLDVACGTGIMTRLAYKKVGPDGSAAGLDVHPAMLAVARSIPENDTHIDWYEASAEAIPIADNRFDVVLCQMGLQFMQDKIIALKEMLRVLKAGGRLVLNLPGPREELFSIMAEAMEKNINSQAAEFVNVVFSLHEIKEIKSLFNEAGFKEIKINEYKKILDLPQAHEFLWQYMCSTPLAAFIGKSDEQSLLDLEKDVTGNWQDFSYNGGMRYNQRMVQVIARKI